MQRQRHSEGQCWVLLTLLGSGRSEVGFPPDEGWGHGHGQGEGGGQGASEEEHGKICSK